MNPGSNPIMGGSYGVPLLMLAVFGFLVWRLSK